MENVKLRKERTTTKVCIKSYYMPMPLEHFGYILIIQLCIRHELRSNNNKLMLSKPKTNSLKRTFGYAAAKVWNERNKNS
jgi:hypothetical protein